MKSTASKKQLKGIYKWYSTRKFRHIMSAAVKEKLPPPKGHAAKLKRG
jgi:hypothetical protein